MKRSVAGTRPRDDGACGGIAPGWPVAALGDAERGWRGQDGGGGKGGEEGRSVRGWRPATTGLPRGRRSVACRMMPPETRRRRTIIFCTGSDGARLRLMRSSCFMKTECYKACSLSNRRF
ncbi:unnamed protein product [Prorocentrum cordatum]|uniref:Uncharacterized protein n=1 Tax=Prorocentrum cordatum TaxID=2364126 RepID=A0ABN9UWY2_9DINO|nr:unnamed protein product [Polarella glacialis]